MDPTAFPQLTPRRHIRAASRSPTRSPTRQRLTDDILADLSPATTLDAFTSPSGKLKASVEAATPSERAFGIRATLASKKIQEWLTELSAWPWPKSGGSQGFEVPNAKRRRVLSGSRDNGNSIPESEYMGSLRADDVDAYEIRIEEILEDMDDLHVEEIKSTVLNSHFSPVSRPSSSASHSSNPPITPALLSSYTKMDDFTAVVTATVLQALPNLSRLMRLMDVWSIRLSILRKVPPLLDLLDDVEIAVKSGWQALESPSKTPTRAQHVHEEQFLDRKTFEAMRDVLQDKVTRLGQDMDYMLDTLEGRADTLPEHWLDRMEALEGDYGEWVVSGEKVVREGEWDRITKARKAEEARRRAEEEARQKKEEEARRKKEEEQARLKEEAMRKEELARQEAERIRREDEERLRLEAARLEAARLETARLEAARLEAASLEAARLEAARLEAARVEKELEEAALRLEEEKKAEVARLLAEETRQREEAARLAEAEAEAAKAAELERQAQEARAQRALRRQQERAALAAKAAEMAQQAEQARIDRENALELEQRAAEAARLEAEAEQSATSANQHPTDPAATEFTAQDISNEKIRSVEVGDELSTVGDLPTVAMGAVSGLFSVLGIKSANPEVRRTDPSDNAVPLIPKLDSVDENSDAEKIHESILAPTTLAIAHQLCGDIPEPPGTDGDDLGQPPLPSQDVSMPSDNPEAIIRPVTPDASEGIAMPHVYDEWVVIDTPAVEPSLSTDAVEQEDQEYPDEIPAPGFSTPPAQSRRTSLLSGYDLSQPSPEVLQAQPAEYIRPNISPLKPVFSSRDIEAKTPSGSPQSATYVPDWDSVPAESPSPSLRRQPSTEEISSSISSTNAQDSPFNDLEALGYYRDDIQPPTLASRTSVIHIKVPIRRIDLSRRDSTSSNTSTANSRQRPHTGSPVASSPISVGDTSDLYGESPSAGRVSHLQEAYDYTPPGSPLLIPPRVKPHTARLSPTLSSPSTDSPLVEVETPVTELSLDPSSDTSTHPPSSPKKHAKSTDDQMQAQISSLLESIPARIRLTSEPPETPQAFSRSVQTETLRVPRTRPSFGSSSVRSFSSLSMRSRAPTPSFTLAPAYGKGGSRPRPPSNNPEIKLYHLSRSGEAPIKLFVRLVGENGERVMVRVGGGWADLGEYLKEYASHHGRRSGSKEDSVEIQDLGSRNVSGASINSSSTPRGGRTTPSPRSASVLERERPMSSLYIRKTRKSDADSTVAASVSLRAPSTPVVFTSQTAGRFGTPPSAPRPEEHATGLGLAGPKSKNVKISERDAEWVESMKEKVRLASAEKDRRQRGRSKGSRGSFGDVGGTKQVFKKGP